MAMIRDIATVSVTWRHKADKLLSVLSSATLPFKTGTQQCSYYHWAAEIDMVVVGTFLDKVNRL